MDCIFCKIAKKEISSDILHEDEAVIVFKDAHPSAPVHYLIVPKEHIQSIAHLGPVRGREGSSYTSSLRDRQRASASNGVGDNHSELVAQLIYVAKNMAEKLGLKGYKLVFNVGRDGGQVIDHLHLHLLGGWNRKSDIEAMPSPDMDK